MINTETIPRGLKLHHLGGIEIVAGRFRNHALPRHSHDGLMLSLVSDGVQKLQYKGVTHLAGAGTLLAIPPNEVHSAEPGEVEGWLYHTITIPSEMLDQYRNEGSHFFCETLIFDIRMKDFLVKLFQSLNDAPVLEQEEALMDVLERFLTQHAGLPQKIVYKPTEKRVVNICQEYLAECVDRNVSLAELSEIAQINRFQLVRCFTNIVGMPPHAWHIQRRFQKSLELLSKGNSIADVAAETGFADQAHLTRTFKRMTGITPGRYRKGHFEFRSQSVDGKECLM